MIQDTIARLVQYAYAAGLIGKEDRIWAANSILSALQIDALDERTEQAIMAYSPDDGRGLPYLAPILEDLCDYAVHTGLIQTDSVTYRDLFDTKIMGLLTPRC